MRRLTAIASVWTAWLLASTTADAQSLAAGTTKYQHGDCPGAERALNQALRTAPAADVKAKIYKLMGICQYADGDQAGATASFRKALALSPNLTVVPTEVIDESVVEFFNQLKPSADKPAANAGTAVAAQDGAQDPGIPPTPDARVPGAAGAGAALADAAAPGAAAAPEAAAAAAKKKKKKKKRKKSSADVVDAELVSDQAAPPASAYGDEAPPAEADLAPADGAAVKADDEPMTFGAPSKAKKGKKVAADVEYRTPRRVLIDLLPFGAGQYQNGEVLLGAAFTVTQAYSLYIYYSRTQAIAKAQKQGKDLVAQRRANNQDLSPADNAFLNSTLSYEHQQQQQAKYGEVAFGLLWAASTVEALLYTPSTSSHDHIKRRKYGYVPDVEYVPGPGLGSVRLAWDF